MKSTTSIRFIGLLAILAIPFGGAFTCPADGSAAGVEPLGEPLRSKQWKLVFSDEFDGPKLDESKWTRRGHGEAFVWNGAKGRLSEDHADVDGRGHFVVKVSRDADGSYLKDNLFGRAPWNLKFRPNEGISSPSATGIGASHRGLWVTYTVEVQRTGDYRVTPLIARPDAMRGYSEKPDRILLEADGEPLAEFSFAPELTTGRNYWGDYQPLPSQTVRLADGIHVLCVRFDATPFNFGGLEFTPATVQMNVERNEP